MSSLTQTDRWGGVVELHRSYIAYRNRLIDVHLIHTFQVKGKRLLVNTYKQNSHIPTMCIFFDSKEKAEAAYQVMKAVYYGPCVLTKTQSSQDIPLGFDILLAITPMVLMCFYLFSKHLFSL